MKTPDFPKALTAAMIDGRLLLHGLSRERPRVDCWTGRGSLGGSGPPGAPSKGFRAPFKGDIDTDTGINIDVDIDGDRYRYMAVSINWGLL